MLVQILDAFQQILDAVMEKTGEVRDVDAQAEKLIETMNVPKAELTKILLPRYVSIFGGRILPTVQDSSPFQLPWINDSSAKNK